MADTTANASPPTAQDDDASTLVQFSLERISLFESRIVTILVGEPPTKFTVHEEVMNKATESNYWRVVFQNGFEETDTGILKLPEEDPRAFNHFTQWAYSMASGFVHGERDYLHGLSTSELIKLYCLAEYFMIKCLADTIITAMRDQATAYTWYNVDLDSVALEHLVQRTNSGCHMERLLVDWIVEDALTLTRAPSKDDNEADIFPLRLLRAAFNKMARVEIGFRIGPLCSYHHHKEDEKCGSVPLEE